MWKISKNLAACVFAAVWWGIFYPELCFSEETCVVVQTEYARNEGEKAQQRTEYVRGEGEKAQRRSERAQDQDEGLQGSSEEIDAAAVWHASGDEIVISSRFWEWCMEKLGNE